jgi:hypothetical protein
MKRTRAACWLVSTTVLLLSVSVVGSLICVHLRDLRTIFSLHPGLREHVLTDIRQSPLRGELVPVLLEQAFGVDAVSLKRPAREVVDEQVMSHGQLKTGPSCSLGQVVVDEPQPELLIEPADGFVDRSLHEQAEPG